MRYGANPNTLNAEGNSFLHILIDLFEKDLVDYSFFSSSFITNFIDPNYPDKDGKLPLQKVINYSYNSLKKINLLGKFLIEHRAHIFPKNLLMRYEVFRRMNALHLIDLIKGFLNSQDRLDEPLRSFFTENRTNFSQIYLSNKKLKDLLPRKGKYIKLDEPVMRAHSENLEIKTLAFFLDHAIKANCIEVIEFLINYKSELINLPFKKSTPLMKACKQIELSLVSFFINKGADINTKFGTVNAFMLLIDHLEKQLVKTEKELTKKPDKKIISILSIIEFCLRNNADPNISNSHGHGFLILLIRLCLRKPEMLEKIMGLVKNNNIKFDLLFKDDNNNLAIDTLLKIGHKINPLFAAILLSSSEFYSLKHLFYKSSESEREKIGDLLKTMEVLKADFNQKPSLPQNLQNFIPLTNEIHAAFSKIKKRDAQPCNLFDIIYEANLSGVKEKKFEFNEHETILIFTFGDIKFLQLMQDKLKSLQVSTEVHGNRLKAQGIENIKMRESQMNEFCRKYQFLAKRLEEKELPVASVYSPSTPDSSPKQTQSPKSSEQPTIKNNHCASPKKISKGELGKAQVEAKLREKKEKHKAEKSPSQKKVISPKTSPSEPKETKQPKPLLPELPILANPPLLPILEFPALPIIEKIPGRGPRSLPISGNEGFSVLTMPEKEQITPIKIKKSKKRKRPRKFKWLPEQRKRIEIARDSLQVCESLALRLQDENFQFSKNLMSWVYKKSFEYRFLRGLEALAPASKSKDDSKASLFKTFKKHHLDAEQLRNLRNWMLYSFPLIKGATLHELALKFNSAQITSKMNYFLNIEKVKKNCEAFNLSEFTFSPDAFELKLEKLDAKKKR